MTHAAGKVIRASDVLDIRGIQTGTATTGTHVVNTTLTTAVVFPVAFAAAPIVMVTGKADPVNLSYPEEAQNVTATGFDLKTARAVGTAAFDVMWLAVLI